MQGDFSRQTFDKTKHYSGVLMQQGRVQLDADANEQQAIDQYRDHSTSADLVGPSGTPKVGDGFKVGLSGNAQDVTIAPGHMYVDGILCENETEVSLRQQPDLPLKQSNLGGFTLPTVAGRYLVYLDVWQRHITALDDPQIKETALGGPDTTTRVKTVWQIKLFPVSQTTTCAGIGSNWRPIPASTGQMKASTTTTPSSSDPCVLPSTGGYRRLENQLYRVEVHRGGPRAQATFKWSRDNGSVVTAITSISGQNVDVHDIGRDAVLGFADGQWVELIDDRLELSDPDASNMRGQLVQINRVTGQQRIQLKPVPPGLPPRPTIDPSRHAKLRRWDQTGVSGGTSGVDNGVPMTSTPMELEGGIVVEFGEGTYSPGDYWLIPARTAISGETGGIEWPRDAGGQFIPQAPRRIEHHYTPLALVDFNAGVFTLVPNGDCRKRFPALTAIAADDVSFDNATCQLPNVTNVQQALEHLCQRKTGGHCTFVVSPQAGWEAIFNQIGPAQHAQICFEVGTYPLDQAVRIQGKGNLTLVGCGSGTRIIAANAEVALTFEGCGSVTVRDLYAETRRAAAQKNTPDQHLNGTLSFLNCEAVTVEHVTLRCGAAVTRAATCLTVRNDATRPRPTRIKHCDLLVGHEQVGILLVNTLRASVEDNTIQVYAKPARLTFDRLLQNKIFRAAVRRLLITDVQTGEPPAQGGKSLIRLSLGEQRLFFRSHKTFAKPLQQLFSASIPRGTNSIRGLLAHTQKTVDRLLLDAATREAVPPFKAWFDELASQSPAVGAQGIVVAGQVARDVCISNNTIQDVLQGVRVGLSHARDPQRPGQETPDIAGTVRISGNTINVMFPPVALRERYGIFVGNCDSLLVADNYIRVQRFAATGVTPIDGIRVYGFLGRMMIVRQNHLVNCTTGIYTHVLNPREAVGNRLFQWLVENNMAPEAAQAVRVVEPRAQIVRLVNNYT